MDQNMTNGLTQQWSVVVDARGHEHLESRWVTPQMATAHAAVHAA